MVDINQLISQSTTVLVQLQNVLQPTGVALKLKMIGLTQLVAQSTTVAASLPFSWLGVTLLVLALVIRSLISTMRSKGKLPPGPRGLPFLGNLFQIPDMPWLRFTEWKDEFGPIISLKLAGQSIVILNSHKVANDLLERRSNIYNDRQRLIVANEILCGGLFLPLVNGELWRKMRRAGHEGLSIRASEIYQPLQEREAALLVRDLLHVPEAWDEHLRRSAASAALAALYDCPPIESKDNPLVIKVNDSMHRISRAAVPGNALVEIFPIMNILPSWIAKWKYDGLEWHRKDNIMFQDLFDGVRSSMSKGKFEPSFSASLIENAGRHHLTKKQSAWLAASLFGAGSETTAAALTTFVLAMCLYPDVLRKAQAEIDAVVGQDRMPTFADRPRLPYIQAIVKEVLRWRAPAPLAVPRQSTQDDWYDGYYIPKGSIVIANVWGMNRDPIQFPDFEEFRPERFLDASEEVDGTLPDTHGQGHATYGFGKRICVGMHFANQGLFIDIASIVWAVNIEKAVDENGSVIIPSRTESVDEGAVVRPAPFPCKITARYPEVIKAVEETKIKQIF